MRRRRSWKRKGRIQTWLWRGFVALFLIAVTPLLLTLLYAFTPVQPISTLMVKDLVTLQSYDRRWTELSRIEPRLVHSVMMSEDGQFCNHHGIDMGEMRVIIENALQGEQTRGGSTITMQTVKNLFLWHGRSYIRKAIEIPLAVYVDAVMDKDRIMEIYLNIAEWGPNIYGIEAAAQHHFGSSAGALSARQSALLAVTLPNPHGRNPAQPTPNLQRLAGVIEARARAAGGYVHCLPR